PHRHDCDVARPAPRWHETAPIRPGPASTRSAARRRRSADPYERRQLVAQRLAAASRRRDADHARRHPLAHATVGSGERVQRDMGHFLVFVIMESQDDVRPRVADAFARYEERVAGDENAIHVAYYLLGGRWHAALTGQRPDDLA